MPNIPAELPQLRRADNVAITQINQLVRVIALAPTSPAVAVHSCLLAHEIGDRTACDAALRWLQKTIEDFPSDAGAGSHQLEKCLAASGYYRASILVGRARNVDDLLLINYVHFARQEQWFGLARMAAEVAFLIGELDAARDAREYLRRNLGQWRLQGDQISAAHAYAGLGGSLTAHEAAWLIEDAGAAAQSGESNLEASALMLLALDQLNTEAVGAAMVTLSESILAALEAQERSLRAVAHLQATLYLSTAPMSRQQFAHCIGAIRDTSGSPVLRKMIVEDGKVVVDVAGQGDSADHLGGLPIEDLALAAYTLTKCGYSSVIGVHMSEVDNLRAQLKKATSVRSGSFVVGTWEMAAYNIAVMVVVLGAVFAWIFFVSGGTATPKPDWASVIQAVVMPWGIIALVAAGAGFVTHRRVLTGFITWMLDLAGQRAEQRDRRISEDQDA